MIKITSEKDPETGEVGYLGGPGFRILILFAFAIAISREANTAWLMFFYAGFLLLLGVVTLLVNLKIGKLHRDS